MTAKIVDEPSFRGHIHIFKDRTHAGKLLARKLTEYAGRNNVILLAVPSGGVHAGFEVANELMISMDVIVVRKIQIPWNTEAGFGALTWNGEIALNETLVESLNLTEKMIKSSAAEARRIVQERLRKFRVDRPMPNLTDKVVIIIDDGLASGFTTLAAVRSIKKNQPEKIVVAVPTGSLRAIETLAEVDQIICLNIRSAPVFAVADTYQNWYDLTDEEVLSIFEKLRTSGLDN
ncbi:MAG: phosphoribosyltransferase family protein [Candidatus Bathyarchaeia archaeon]